ncbi:MAG: MarR family EPS-associated transcriptional regulator [Deltaproteobacteria bacterium]|nr:MarR family EPS-associated transcriptional regulator [Deltaproteobacteria bacterium]
MRILKILATTEHEITQRDMAQSLNISLGKTNYCLAGLVEKGYIRIKRFKNSHNKAAYAYLLTPSGIEEKVQLTVKFLKLKLREYETLETEIEELRTEIADLQLESKIDGIGCNI